MVSGRERDLFQDHVLRVCTDVERALELARAAGVHASGIVLDAGDRKSVV